MKDIVGAGSLGIAVGAVGTIIAYIIGFMVLRRTRWGMYSVKYVAMQVMLIVICPLILLIAIYNSGLL